VIVISKSKQSDKTKTGGRLYLHIHLKQEQLSYSKLIARKLRTRYVEGFNVNPVTLKSRLSLTRGHWKRNHWTDHTRRTISRVI